MAVKPRRVKRQFSLEVSSNALSFGFVYLFFNILLGFRQKLLRDLCCALIALLSFIFSQFNCNYLNFIEGDAGRLLTVDQCLTDDPNFILLSTFVCLVVEMSLTIIR